LNDCRGGKASSAKNRRPKKKVSGPVISREIGKRKGKRKEKEKGTSYINGENLRCQDPLFSGESGPDTLEVFFLRIVLPLVVQTFQLYLVVDNKLAYVINWVATNRWQEGKESAVSYQVLGGELVSTLPLYIGKPGTSLYRGKNYGKKFGVGGTDPDESNPITGVLPLPLPRN
jgi:hypothetical protein